MRSQGKLEPSRRGWLCQVVVSGSCSASRKSIQADAKYDITSPRAQRYKGISTVASGVLPRFLGSLMACFNSKVSYRTTWFEMENMVKKEGNRRGIFHSIWVKGVRKTSVNSRHSVSLPRVWPSNSHIEIKSFTCANLLGRIQVQELEMGFLTLSSTRCVLPTQNNLLSKSRTNGGISICNFNELHTVLNKAPLHINSEIYFLWLIFWLPNVESWVSFTYLVFTYFMLTKAATHPHSVYRNFP